MEIGGIRGDREIKQEKKLEILNDSRHFHVDSYHLILNLKEKFQLLDIFLILSPYPPISSYPPIPHFLHAFLIRPMND